MPTPAANILIVDDEPGPRESLRLVLKEDYQVTCAADGRQALQIVRARPVDLVTLDLHLPGLEGLDLLRQIKALDPNIEVIVVTGCGDLSSAIESIHHGVFDYLTKPFNIAEIKMAVAKSLERRRLNLELARFFKELEAQEARGEGSLPEALSGALKVRQQMARTERLATVGLMTAGFIHEINNPLASVVALAELALSRLRQPGRGADPGLADIELSLQKIVRESKRISRLATRMLGLAREKGASGEEAEAASVIEEALELLSPQATRKGIELHWQPPENLSARVAEADQLKQVLLNLLINAVQATPEGGSIRVEAEAAGPSLRLRVADTGCGIAPEDLGKVFEPFFTTKGEGEGTGLGLYICRQIMQRLGGSLEVASRRGRGTTFTLELPLT